MSLQRVRSRGSVSRNSASNALQDSDRLRGTPSEAIDIGSLVKRYKRLEDLLFPFKVVWDASHYIVRWENYPLTVAVVFVLCVLLYYPSLFLACLTLLAIAAMAVGKYYSITKSLSLLKTREPPNIEQLNHDLQELQHIEREQKSSHLLLLEYKLIMQNVERYFLLLTKFLDYLYRVFLWKSPEVSLCVTVLLCLCFVLFCTVYLRLIACCAPVLTLCLNRHFLKRTVDLWRTAGLFVYSHVRLKRQPAENELATPSHKPCSENGIAEEGERSIELMANGQCEETGEGSQLEEEVELVASTTFDTEQSSDPAAPRDLPRPGRTTNVPVRCTKCDAPFTLIKRRHDCANCGNTFCGSCTVKKKRAFLGATAPAAYERSVRVCNDCKSTLETVMREVQSRDTIIVL
ncbi:protrudin-like [Halichondria panicea]|uniref:protrudin-like n=1 Tax=Halichondria panicea TaxID=6063 RepID=UPI00312BC002